ncbi:cubilin-like [Acanthaster planci]|uniref:Cubilin-like n=1 Tax=Acanthaster planci TaxID=133434 RepID=A0A8B7XPQ4_ACAPL|nr:cubilin-like [Acanthaster planci]XP_022082804.1 cubilin-like [Acanthaster planci]
MGVLTGRGRRHAAVALIFVFKFAFILVDSGFGWEVAPLTKRLFTPNHRVSWDVQWGECSRSCGQGEVKARAVCLSETTNHELGYAACHGIPKPVVPERRTCEGNCASVAPSRSVEEDHLEKRQDVNNATSPGFAPVHCDRVIQSETGEVSSPDWPMKSVHFLQCQITLMLPQDKRPRLRFDVFVLEGSAECSEGNYVEIIDLVTNRSEVICGSHNTFTWTADSNQVQVRFSAESSNVFHRFHATYRAILKAPVTACSSVFDGPMGMYVSDVHLLASQPASCEVLFHASPDDRVVLSFALFTVLCSKPVLIKCINTGAEKTICGDYEPFSWSSSGNEAVLTYELPTSTEQENWEFEVEYEPLKARPPEAADSDCSQIIYDSVEGVITSPAHPESYHDNAYCRTLIMADPGQIITLAFQEFMVEPSNKQNGEPMENCQFDHVMVVDVTTDRADVFCGMRQPFAWTSDSNEILVVFVSDNSEAYTGYKAQYTVHLKHPEPDCLVVTDSENTAGEITTGLYPQPYPSNSECYLTVHQDLDTYVIFEIVTFDLEESDECEKDYLQLTDLTTRRMDRFCGNLHPFTWTSDSNEVQVAFRSDDIIQGGGFHLFSLASQLPPKNIPERDCRQHLTRGREYIRLPLTLGNPPLGDVYCYILITVDPARRIILNMDTFAIEPPPLGFEPDFVEIRDVFLEGDGRIERLEGQLPSFTWTSSRNELVIVATQQSSDIASVRLHGTYHAAQRPIQACSGMILEDNAVIRWPTDFSSASSDCELTIHTHPLKRVIFTFDKMEVPGTSCQEFYVEVLDVEPGRTLSYCQTQKPFSVISTSNEMRLRFQWTNSEASAARRQLAGDNEPVVVKHYVMDRPLQAVEHVAEYHRIFRKEQGEFSSLDHSRALWMDGNCSVLIEVPSDKQILIHFQDFLIGEQPPKPDESAPVICRTEFVQVEDVTNGRKNVFCGHYSYFSWLSDTNAVLVTFFTNPVIVYHGFRAKYETVVRGRAPSEHTSEETGSFQSTNFPTSYPSPHEESWVMHSPPDYIISLVVDSFDLEESVDCNKDYVKFEDLSSGYSSVLCGTHGLFAWTSEGNEVLVTMVGDEDTASSGISLTHSQVDVSKGCFLLLRGESGSLKSSEFLQPNEVWRGSCKLIIHTSPDKRLSLLVEGVNVEEHCGNSGVTIVDIATLRSKIICEVSHDLVFTSDSNEVAFGYINYQTTLPDFTVSWESIHRDVYPVECTDVFDQTPERISVDTYRPVLLLLPTDAACHILLTLPPEEAVALVFQEFSLPGADCERHYVELEDLASLRYDRYCKPELPFSWKSDSNEVMIRFARTNNASGMEVVAEFSSIQKPKQADCSKVLTGDIGDLQSVNYPLHYPTHTECQTLIHTDTDKRVQIVFSEFELEEESRDAGCTSDYLKLTDLTTGRSSTLCGLLAPFIWSSTANEILLEFMSDDSNTFSGYSAFYNVLPRIPKVPGCNETLTSETGVVQSPNNASSTDLYPNSMVCYQHIEVEPSQHVILSFSVLRVESDPNCQKDYVELIDGITGDTDIYCGDIDPFTWISDGNEVIVKFQTDADNRFQGYKATFKALGNEPFSNCDAFFSADVGTVQSPGFPSRYGNNLHCVTIVTGQEHHLIQLVFATFDLEDSEGCTYDYLELRTQGIGAPLTSCGVKAPFSWLSAGNVAILTFHSDYIVTSLGFKADYELVAKPSHLKACDESFFTPNGTLSSPLYPKQYPSNKDCRTTITAQPDYVIQIYFSDFELEFHENCDYDYVLLRNFPDGPIDKYCGTLDPFTWVSKTNQAVLEFHSDASTRMKGYLAYFITYPAPLLPAPTEHLPAIVSKCNIEMTAERGVITSPNFPYEYDNDQNCRTEIETDVGTRINVTFHFMDIEEHRGCQWDRVEIEDMGSGRKSEPFCGSLFGGHRSWQSDTNHIVVIFVSDDIVTRIGFYATYSVVGTSGSE